MIHVAPHQAETPLDALALSERFVLWNLRAWACCCRARRLPAEPVVAALAKVGAPEAAAALDRAMTRLVIETPRPLVVSCPPCPSLSEDERILVAAAAAAQRHDREDLARLFAGLLPPPASALVGRALIELGAAIARVGILLPQPIARDAVAPPPVWPAPASATLH